jgi:hypothetical protein
VDGKYKSLASFSAAYAARQYTRFRIRKAVKWEKPGPLEVGCTVIVGMSHRLPGVLIGNLRCLWRNRWTQLKRVIVVVDSTADGLPQSLVRRAKMEFREPSLEFVFYSKEQSELAGKIHLPYMYSWLSWCIGLSIANTSHVFIHDYDALIVKNVLGKRYERFARSRASIQGIGWYSANGIEASDRLAQTFEAFLDLAWVRNFSPIALFNQVALRNWRTRDYDTLLEVQDRFTPSHARDIVEMGEDVLVHPSQMVHQYTMFHRSPGKALPCFSVAMIPFFNWLSGDEAALDSATRRLLAESPFRLNLLGDGTQFNLAQLDTLTVDWNLKQMINACEGLGIAPFGDLIAYGDALYSITKTSNESSWTNGFSSTHLDWIRSAMLMHQGMNLRSL